jgi:hypothetical protein
MSSMTVMTRSGRDRDGVKGRVFLLSCCSAFFKVTRKVFFFFKPMNLRTVPFQLSRLSMASIGGPHIHPLYVCMPFPAAELQEQPFFSPSTTSMAPPHLP